jgi:hypothetical protein
MYNSLDIVDIAKKSVIPKVLEDRKKYIPYLDKIKKFAIEHGVYALQDVDTSDIHRFKYDLYTYNAVKISRALCDYLYEDDDPVTWYVKVLTKIKYYRFVIMLNERELCTVTDIPNYRNARISDIIDKVEKDGMLYIGPEIYLISTYDKLCDTTYEDEWPELLKSIKALKESFIHLKSTAVHASVDVADSVSQKEEFSAEEMHYELSLSATAIQTKKSVFEAILSSDILIRAILIGEMALKLYQKQNPSTCVRMQLLTSIGLVEEARNIIDVCRSISVLSYKDPMDPQLPIDPRLRRVTLYLNGEPIIDIFNTASYLPIPIQTLKYDSTHGQHRDHDRHAGQVIQVAIPFVLLKFRLIDIWTIRVLKGIRVIKDEYASHMIGVFRQSYKSIFEYLNLKIQRNDVEKIKYVGIYDDYETKIKRDASSESSFIHPYYPRR